VTAPDRYAVIPHAIAVVRQLRENWRTRYELAESLGLHERTIRRIVDALRAANVQIEQRARGATRQAEYRLHGDI
jgi:predicted ArsR family transcriptional regulator